MVFDMKLSIVIVSWNVRDYLKGCLESVLSTLNIGDYEIFVVDNCSIDGSGDYVARTYPNVSLILNTDNKGFARANNQAIARCHGEYVLLLNPDTIVMARSINKMVHYLDRNSDVGIIGPKILSGDGTTISPCGGRMFPSILSIVFRITTLDRRFKWCGSYSMAQWDRTDSREVDAVSGCCMLVRYAAIQQAGMLDDRFFMYAEDIDWCYRIKQAGWRVYYYSDGEIVHYGEKSAAQLYSDDDNALEVFKTYYAYFKKHKGAPYAMMYRVTLAIAYFCLNMLWLVALIFKVKKRDTARCVINRNGKFLGWCIGLYKGSCHAYVMRP